MEQNSNEKKYSEYISYLKKEYNKLCETPDKSLQETAYRETCKNMFDDLSYEINKYKIDILWFELEKYAKLK
jgi:hypothetical protein